MARLPVNEARVQSAKPTTLAVQKNITILHQTLVTVEARSVLCLLFLKPSGDLKGHSPPFETSTMHDA